MSLPPEIDSQIRKRFEELEEEAEQLVEMAKEEDAIYWIGATSYTDALAQNQSAIEVMGQQELAVIATELVKQVRRNATIDWTVKQSARAKMRVLGRVCKLEPENDSS